MIEDYDWDRLRGIYPAEFVEKMKGLDGKACWDGYKLAGTKKKGGKKVDDCVKIKKDAEHGEGDVATAEMTPNYLPKEPIPGGGDLKNPQMAEPQMRMPRSDVLKKASDTNSQLARLASHGSGDGGYSEHSEDAFQSTEPNGGMLITQLKVAREKIDMMLAMMEPEDNFEPWVSTKIANAGVAMASVADYLRFGGET